MVAARRRDQAGYLGIRVSTLMRHVDILTNERDATRAELASLRAAAEAFRVTYLAEFDRWAAAPNGPARDAAEQVLRTLADPAALRSEGASPSNDCDHGGNPTLNGCTYCAPLPAEEEG